VPTYNTDGGLAAMSRVKYFLFFTGCWRIFSTRTRTKQYDLTLYVLQHK